jgi:hypothetical protein
VRRLAWLLLVLSSGGAVAADLPAPAPVRGQRTLADVARDRRAGIKGVTGIVSATESTVAPDAEATYLRSMEDVRQKAANLQQVVDNSNPEARAIFYDCKLRYGVATQRMTDCLNLSLARIQAVKP